MGQLDLEIAQCSFGLLCLMGLVALVMCGLLFLCLV